MIRIVKESIDVTSGLEKAKREILAIRRTWYKTER